VNRIDRTRAALRHALRAPIGRAIRWNERRRAPFKHELAVCAIFREEAPFLDEWISFHHGIGASHFYLYNNFSTDDFMAVLKPWMTRGIVSLIDWPVAVGQLSAYRHCLMRARHECRWLALIDVDEFLFSPVAVNVPEILRRYADLPGLLVWETFFGSGGHESRPAQPVTEAYIRRAPLSQIGAKTIANPRMIYKVGVHRCKYWLGQDRDTARQQIENGRPVLDLLRINHYWSRSLEDLRTKIRRGDASTPKPREDDWHFAFEKSLNTETDETILPVARKALTRPSSALSPVTPIHQRHEF
jgi:hypothetical protein